MSNNYTSRNNLLLNNLLDFYKNEEHIEKMLKIITGESKISLRIVDWFSTNYAKSILLYMILKKMEKFSKDLKSIMITN